MSSPFGVRQRADEHAVDDAEDRGVGADAERHGQDDGGGEAAIPGQPPERRAHILHHAVHVCLSLGARRSAQAQQDVQTLLEP